LKKVATFFLIVLTTSIAAFVFFVFLILEKEKRNLSSPISPGSNEKFTIEVKDGDNLKNVLSKLEEKGLIKNTSLSYITIKLTHKEPKVLLKGVFEFEKNLSLFDVLEKIEEGESLKKGIRIIIKEGYDTNQIGEVLENFGLVKKEDFLLEISTKFQYYKEKFTFLSKHFPEAKSLEGFFFPDTYSFEYEETLESIISKMISNFEKKALPYFEEFERSELSSVLKTEYDALIFSSIVEKETGRLEDTPKIASVFLNRLKIDMFLQSDATLNYVLPTKKRQLSIEDLKSDSPYNSYKFKGLPPTPISNPGIHTIENSLNPEKTDFFFFFATEDLVSHFSKTYEEHMKKRAEFGV